MDHPTAVGTLNSGEFSVQIDDIQALLRIDPSPDNSSSFTALLGLPPTQAMELLHHQDPPPPPQIRVPDFPSLRCSPSFPSNAVLVDRAARYSVFSAVGSPEVKSNSSGNNSPLVKPEPADSDSNPASSFPSQPRRCGKRKELEKSKAKSGGKKSKSRVDGETAGDGEKLPYVHVRARRGQATDSHSLAERARREKINARMKLLQELVPGCSKISGTALVLDEIINHVQSLQRQVEFLSMRLAAVNPRIDFGGLDNFLTAENSRLTVGDGGVAVGLEASMWAEVHVDGVRRQQQIWQVDLSSPNQSSSSPLWDRDDNHHHGFIGPGPSLFSYDSANPVSRPANELKTEL